MNPRLPTAERLAELDDVHDTIEYTHLSVQGIDADVIAEAHRPAALAISTCPRVSTP